MHQIFISYPDQNKEIVENLANRLRELGVEAWIYSLSKTLAEDTWKEIQEKINNCDVFLFVASEYSLNANGQHQELELALEKIKSAISSIRFLPVIADETGFHSLPEELRYKNGLKLDAHTVKSTAIEIANTFFPDLKAAEITKEWKYPLPGQWLVVCNIDHWTEEYFDLGDKVYFRRISPLGLFECYAPKIKGSFWFASHNLRMTDITDEAGILEREEVPPSYQIDTIYKFERLGLDDLRKRGLLDIEDH